MVVRLEDGDSAPNKTPQVLVFDMDGVLVDVRDSYREAVRETVRHFSGESVSHEEIQKFKNAGGWNNDWLLSHRLILDRGRQIAYEDVVAYFNKIFMGENGDGLIRREKWLPKPGLLERLSEHAALAIFTGRVCYEVDATLGRYGGNIRFHPIVTDEMVSNPKPAPEGLRIIQQAFPARTLWYLGDTVDDAGSAKAAGVPFLGVSTAHDPNPAETKRRLEELDAFAILGNVNDLEPLFMEALRSA